MRQSTKKTLFSLRFANFMQLNIQSDNDFSTPYQEDEFFLDLLIGHTGHLLSFTEMLHERTMSVQAYQQLCQFAIDIIDCTIPTIFGIVRQCALSTLEIRKCCLYLLDEDSMQLWTINEEQRKIVQSISNIATSVLGQAATSCETVVQILGLEAVESSDDTAESILLKPRITGSPVICPNGKKVVGVIELITARYELLIFSLSEQNIDSENREYRGELSGKEREILESICMLSAKVIVKMQMSAPILQIPSNCSESAKLQEPPLMLSEMTSQKQSFRSFRRSRSRSPQIMPMM